MAVSDEDQTPLSRRIIGALALLFAVGAVGRGLLLDAEPVLTQPQLFWSFTLLGLGGCLLGWRFAMRHDPHLGRNLLALFGTLLAWRLSYFPLMVLSGWKASIVEWLCWKAFGASFVYPTFLLVLYALNLAIGAVASAAVAVPRTPGPETGRLRRLLHKPPRRLLWVVGLVALPVAFMTSFSWPEDYTVMPDRPWAHAPVLPPVRDPESNPYFEILDAHGDQMGLCSKVLALNAALTYPLVPEAPWGKAIKGTLEAETRADPLASSSRRTQEHYLAYLAAHQRLHGEPQ